MMKEDTGLRRGKWQIFGVLAAAIAVLNSTSRADIVELVNGDRYSGTVISVTMSNVTVRSSVQGVITLPRGELATIQFGEPPPKSSSIGVGSSSGKVPSDDGVAALAQRLLRGRTGTNQADKIAEQLLEDAGPEATQKYNQMVRGLLSGSLSVGDLRKQAAQAITDAEQAREELGPEAGELLEGYLSILRRFVQETAPKPKSP